jgi:hypothetical protein
MYVCNKKKVKLKLKKKDLSSERVAPKHQVEQRRTYLTNFIGKMTCELITPELQSFNLSKLPKSFIRNATTKLVRVEPQPAQCLTKTTEIG